MELWFTEKHTESTGISIKITDCLYREKTKYQDLAILKSPEYGRILVLDGLIMLSERDEFAYHEMITHVPLLSHGNPHKVLIIGGGDGGTAREVLKHKEIEKIDLVEIDERVIEKCKEYLPAISCGLDSEKVSIHITDGVSFVQNCSPDYDVVIIDSTDPIGPGKGLITKSFYQNVFSVLREDGIMVAQAESPFLHKDIIVPLHRKLSRTFPISTMYLTFIPTYPTGCWSFAWCSKKYTPCEHLNVQRYKNLQPAPKYYNLQVHQASFHLPNFVRDLLPNGNTI